MAVQTKMSRRDKLLIYFCIIFVIAAGTYIFLISPMLDKKTKLEESLTEKTIQADEIESDSLMHDIVQEQNDEFVAEFNTASEGFYSTLFNEEADDFLTKTMQKNKLTPTVLEIDNESEETSETIPYNYNLAADNDTEFKAVTSVKEIIVNINCSGKVTDIKNFIDTMYSTDGVNVSSYSLKQTDEQNTSVNKNVISAISAPVQVLSINKSDATAEAVMTIVISTYDKDAFLKELEQNKSTEESDDYADEDFEEETEEDTESEE